MNIKDIAQRVSARHLQKTADSSRVMETLMSKSDILAVLRMIRKTGDKQMEALWMDIYEEWQRILDLPANQAAALNRTLSLLERNAPTDPAELRNQVFKIGALLGLKLPSGDF
jgi:hypothetical protein